MLLVHALVQLVHIAFCCKGIPDEARHKVALLLLWQAYGYGRHGAGVAFQIEGVLPDVMGEHVLRERAVCKPGDEGMDQNVLEDGKCGLPGFSAPAARVDERRQALRLGTGHGWRCQNGGRPEKRKAASQRGGRAEETAAGEMFLFHGKPSVMLLRYHRGSSCVSATAEGQKKGPDHATRAFML